MNYYTTEVLRLEGIIAANLILEHRCGWCRVPFLSCKARRAMVKTFDGIVAQLEAQRDRAI